MITELKTIANFQELLQTNKCLVIIEFSAKWCDPCKTIKRDVMQFFNNVPSKVQCIMLDIDEFPQVYNFLKSKRMVYGIPALLCYYKGNTSYVPDDSVVGANKNVLMSFFNRCMKYASEN